MILLESVSKTYEMGEGVVRALDHVDLQVDQGDFLAIVGPSGSGKSTLMNILGLLDVPDEGRYLLDGMDVGALSDNRLASIRNEKIGFVFQSFNLLGKLTALENVKLPLSYAGVRLKEADARARKQLSLVGLEGREHHLPNQLSGGQQQRVAIARASRRSSWPTSPPARSIRAPAWRSWSCSRACTPRARRLSSSRTTRSSPTRRSVSCVLLTA